VEKNQDMRRDLNDVFLVYLLREDPDGHEDLKFLEVYSTRARAQGSVNRHTTLPGFSDYPDGFSISKCELNKDYWTEGFIDLNASKL
jgi:hypothetical protein